MADVDAPTDPRAFALRSEFSDITGATTSYGGEGRTFDIVAALNETPDKGLIVLDANADSALAEVLGVHHALKSAPVPKAAKERLQKAANDAASEPVEPEPTGAASVEAAEAQGQNVEAEG